MKIVRRKGGECVSLEGASINGEWNGVSMDDHVVFVGGGV
jgi:hypothetical protein